MAVKISADKLGITIQGELAAYSDEVAEGHVVDQSPRPPKEVKENARITVRVSRGVEQVEVPDMVGWTRTSASEKVKSINLSILIKYETDDTKPYNTVLRTVPAAGTVLEAGAACSPRGGSAIPSLRWTAPLRRAMW